MYKSLSLIQTSGHFVSCKTLCWCSSPVEVYSLLTGLSGRMHTAECSEGQILFGRGWFSKKVPRCALITHWSASKYHPPPPTPPAQIQEADSTVIQYTSAEVMISHSLYHICHAFSVQNLIDCAFWVLLWLHNLFLAFSVLVLAILYYSAKVQTMFNACVLTFFWWFSRKGVNIMCLGQP